MPTEVTLVEESEPEEELPIKKVGRPKRTVSNLRSILSILGTD